MLAGRDREGERESESESPFEEVATPSGSAL
jgi:hypothetical protein